MRARGLVLVVVVACVLAGGLVFAGASALAGTVYPFVGGFGLFSNPQSVAVDQASGDVYAIDVGSGVVDRFNAAGAPANFSALSGNALDGASGADLTPEGAFAFDSNSAAQVAVDNSGGATDGYVYVANSFHEVVDVFDSTGTYVGEITGAAASPQSGGEACGVATDGAGHVYASYFSGHVDKYSPVDGNPAHDVFAGQLENLSGVCSVAADTAGSIYVSAWSEGPLTRYAESQLGEPSPAGSVVDNRSLAVAVDQASGDVFVDEGNRVAEFDQAGVALGQSGSGTLSGSSYGVAVRGSTGDLYASDAGMGQVDRFGPPVSIEAPVVTIAAATGVSTSQATLHGTVNPGGSEPLSDTTWRFEYSIDGGSSWSSTVGGDVGTGTSPVGVEEQIGGLLPAEEVQVRLEASNAAGSVTSGVQAFSTPAIAPDIATEPAQDITPTHAVLRGTLNAHHAPTTYYFEYGVSAAYGASVPATQDAAGGSSSETTEALQSLYGLTPGAVYHYRLVAHNQAGITHGEDQTFTTSVEPAASAPRAGIPGARFLPDDRGWEQVSPPQKHGADVMSVSARTRAASGETADEPMAATFSSFGGFADAQGTAVATEYMSVRTGQAGTNGWDTHGITPRQDALDYLGVVNAIESLWQGEFSTDLSRGVYLARSALSDAPNVKGVANLYRRDDLRTPGAGTFQLLSDCPLCGSPLPGVHEAEQLPRLAGTSADFSHVIFESTYRLTPEATSSPDHPNLYESVNGVVRLAGILPDSACGSPPCPAPVSFAGQGAGAGTNALRYTPHTISADGSRVFFTDSSTGNLNAGSGDLYMRVSGTSTVQINASEKAVPDTPQPSVYQDASVDGSRVFFTTGEHLTDDPSGSQENLYMYDVNAPAGHHLTLLSPDREPADGASVKGVMGVSDDGQYVYFIAGGQLVAGQPPDVIGIYEWHDGATTYIGRLANAPDVDPDLVSGGVIWTNRPAVVRVSSDGRHLLFSSTSGLGLTGYRQNEHAELYLYSADSHRLQCVSCNPTGAPATADASVMTRTHEGAIAVTFHLSHPLSDDGSRVFFDTGEELVPEDVNGKRDVYEFDTASGTVHLLSSGTDLADSYFLDASADGSDVFFLTRQQLVGWDRDSSYDLYDARVGGGLPDPPSVAAGCVGEGCLGQAPGAPGFLAPSSAQVSGVGNLTPQVAGAGVKVKPKAKKKPRRHRRKRRRVRAGKTGSGKRASRRTGR